MTFHVQPSEARLLTDRLRESVSPSERYDREQSISGARRQLADGGEGGVPRQRFLADGRCQTVAIYYHDDIVNLSRFLRLPSIDDNLLALRGTVLAFVKPDAVEEIRKMSLSGVDGMAGLVSRELGIARERT